MSSQPFTSPACSGALTGDRLGAANGTSDTECGMDHLLRNGRREEALGSNHERYHSKYNAYPSANAVLSLLSMLFLLHSMLFLLHSMLFVRHSTCLLRQRNAQLISQKECVSARIASSKAETRKAATRPTSTVAKTHRDSDGKVAVEVTNANWSKKADVVIGEDAPLLGHGGAVLPGGTVDATNAPIEQEKEAACCSACTVM